MSEFKVESIMEEAPSTAVPLEVLPEPPKAPEVPPEPPKAPEIPPEPVPVKEPFTFVPPKEEGFPPVSTEIPIEPEKPNETTNPDQIPVQDTIPANPPHIFRTAEPGPKPPVTGRHPKGCTCGRCKQSGGTGKKTTPAAQPTFADVLTPEKAQPNYQALADIVFGTATGALTMTFGPEWQPKNIQEKAVVCDALAKYLESKECADLPPGAVLAFVCVAYAAPRLNEPKTKEKLSMTWTWVKTKVSGIFRRRKT